MTQEKLEFVTPFNVIDENDRFAPDELELEEDVDEEKLVLFGCVGVVLCEEGGCFWFGEGEDCLLFARAQSQLFVLPQHVMESKEALCIHCVDGEDVDEDEDVPDFARRDP